MLQLLLVQIPDKIGNFLWYSLEECTDPPGMLQLLLVQIPDKIGNFLWYSLEECTDPPGMLQLLLVQIPDKIGNFLWYSLEECTDPPGMLQLLLVLILTFRSQKSFKHARNSNWNMNFPEVDSEFCGRPYLTEVERLSGIKVFFCFYTCFISPHRIELIHIDLKLVTSCGILWKSVLIPRVCYNFFWCRYQIKLVTSCGILWKSVLIPRVCYNFFWC